MNWSVLTKLMPALIDILRWLVGKAERRAGAAEERARQQETADALQQHYDEIDRTDLSPGDAFGKLRERAEHPGLDAEAADRRDLP